MFLKSAASTAMEKALSGTWQRAQIINHNIANEDTPGYKAKRVAFENVLQNEIQSQRNMRNLSKRDAVSRLEKLTPTVYADESTIGRADGNNVDINAEQIELARVQMQYQALTQRVMGYYSTLKYAISGGR